MICLLLVLVIYTIYALFAVFSNKEVPSSISEFNIGWLVSYVIFMLVFMIWSEYSTKRDNLAEISKSFYVLSVVLILLSITISLGVAYMYNLVLGILLIVLIVYFIMINLSEKSDFWIDLGLFIICLAGGVCLIFIP